MIHSQLLQDELLDSIQKLRVQFDTPMPNAFDEERLHRIASTLVDLSGLVQRSDVVFGTMDHEQRGCDLFDFLNTRILSKRKRCKLKFTKQVVF